MLKRRKEYRWAVAIALVAAAMLAWLSLGVGIIGKDGDPANMMYFGVLLNAFFIGMFIASAVLFRVSARPPPSQQRT